MLDELEEPGQQNHEERSGSLEPIEWLAAGLISCNDIRVQKEAP
jgi:hypothetical protein